ncbi:hypothetical protein [Mixta mediterraneensis]
MQTASVNTIWNNPLFQQYHQRLSAGQDDY